MGTESRGKGVIDQEDALRIFAISVGENYSASNTGVVQPNAEMPIKPLYKRERSGVARLSLGGLSLSLFLHPPQLPHTLTRFSLRHVTEIHRENYVTNALEYISRKRHFLCTDETRGIAISVYHSLVLNALILTRF